jgi:hypothetical protein
LPLSAQNLGRLCRHRAVPGVCQEAAGEEVVGLAACAISGQQTAARWLEHHPKWALQRVRCAVGIGRRSTAVRSEAPEVVSGILGHYLRRRLGRLRCERLISSLEGRVPSSPMIATRPVMSAGQTNSGAINNPVPIIAIPAIVVGCGGQCKTWLRSIFIKKSEGRPSCGHSILCGPAPRQASP